MAQAPLSNMTMHLSGLIPDRVDFSTMSYVSIQIYTNPTSHQNPSIYYRSLYLKSSP